MQTVQGVVWDNNYESEAYKIQVSLTLPLGKMLILALQTFFFFQKADKSWTMCKAVLLLKLNVSISEKPSNISLHDLSPAVLWQRDVDSQSK